MKKYKVCQSCSMPLKNDPQGGGTETDGTISKMYCSKCYENGVFKQPDITAAEMQEFVKNMMITDMKIPKFLAKIFAKRIPKLERWKNN